MAWRDPKNSDYNLPDPVTSRPEKGRDVPLNISQVKNIIIISVSGFIFLSSLAGLILFTLVHGRDLQLAKAAADLEQAKWRNQELDAKIYGLTKEVYLISEAQKSREVNERLILKAIQQLWEAARLKGKSPTEQIGKSSEAKPSGTREVEANSNEGRPRQENNPKRDIDTQNNTPTESTGR